MKIKISLLLLVLCSCKTYEKTQCVETWIDKYNFKYSVWLVKKYNRKTDSLIQLRYDTTKVDLAGKNIAQEVSDLMR